MNKSQLASEIAKKADLSKAKALAALNFALEAIKGSLKKGQRVQLIGFGSFLVRHRKARQGRNPKTGEKITISARKAPGFTPGKTLKKAVR